MRTPEQIIGHDAVTQLIFEGYKVVPDMSPNIGDDVSDLNGAWQGVVKAIRHIDGGVAAPGYAVIDPGRGRPREINLTKIQKCERPEWVTWL